MPEHIGLYITFGSAFVVVAGLYLPLALWIIAFIFTYKVLSSQ